MALTGWLDRRERQAIAYLLEENRLLRRQLGEQRLRLTDDDRRRLAARAYQVGRATLRPIATIATPDSLSVTAFVGDTVVVLFLAFYLLLAGDMFRRRCRAVGDHVDALQPVSALLRR